MMKMCPNLILRLTVTRQMPVVNISSKVSSASGSKAARSAGNAKGTEGYELLACQLTSRLPL